MSFIRFVDICKVFGKGENEVTALNNVNLDIEKGELIAIVGASGSGKTTLLNILGTLEAQTRGEYILENKNTKELNDIELAFNRNKLIGFVVQNFALIKNLNVYDNIEIPLVHGKVKKSMRKSKIIDISDKLGIKDKLKSSISSLSGGQAQRVAIARALVNHTEIILADEPTGALDSKTGKQIIDLLLEINKEGKLVIIVTHDEKIANRCDRVIEMKDGIIIKDRKN